MLTNTVYEAHLKMYFFKNMSIIDCQEEVCRVIDLALCQNETFAALHRAKGYKPYTFNNPYPIEPGGVYKAGNLYTIIVRTFNEQLAHHLVANIGKIETPSIKGITGNVSFIKPRLIEKIYSITPVIVKVETQKYWQGEITFETYTNQIKNNLIKKYQTFTGEQVDEVELFEQFSIVSSKPLARSYKSKHLLGDKLSIEIGTSEPAQKIGWYAVGLGIGEMNSRGFGYVNFKSM